jgi:hypothetical protein
MVCGKSFYSRIFTKSVMTRTIFYGPVTWTNYLYWHRSKMPSPKKNWPVKGLCGRCLSEFVDWRISGDAVSHVGIFDPALWTVFACTPPIFPQHPIIIRSHWSGSTPPPSAGALHHLGWDKYDHDHICTVRGFCVKSHVTFSRTWTESLYTD